MVSDYEVLKKIGMKEKNTSWFLIVRFWSNWGGRGEGCHTTHYQLLLSNNLHTNIFTSITNIIFNILVSIVTPNNTPIWCVICSTKLLNLILEVFFVPERWPFQKEFCPLKVAFLTAIFRQIWYFLSGAPIHKYPLVWERIQHLSKNEKFLFVTWKLWQTSIAFRAPK